MPTERIRERIASEELKSHDGKYTAPDFIEVFSEAMPEEFLVEKLKVAEQIYSDSIRNLREKIGRTELPEEVKQDFNDRLSSLSGRVLFDASPRPGVGGYFELSEQFIGLPVMQLLFSDELDLERIFTHELVHGALVSFDEGMTQAISGMLLGEDGERFAYSNEVSQYKKYFGHLDTKKTLELLSNDPVETLMNIIMGMLKTETAAMGSQMDVPTLKKTVGQLWNTVLRMFPRLAEYAVNQEISNKMESNIAFQEFWLKCEQDLCVKYWGSLEQVQGAEI